MGLASSSAFALANGNDKLRPNDLVKWGHFGRSVSVSGTTALIASPQDGAGSAYVFDLATRQQVGKLVPTDVKSDHWGNAVAIDGTLALVGHSNNKANGSRSGAAYLFDVTTGQLLAKLLPDDGEQDDYFGYSVAISGTTALVGAYRNEDNGPYSGSAYLFDTATGQQLAKLLPDDGAAGDAFGGAVAIRGSIALVGAPSDDDDGTDSGSAYLFDVATGQQIAKLLPSDGAQKRYFGQSVAIDDANALVSTWFHAAYVFDLATGTETAQLLPVDGQQEQAFGTSVAIDGSTAVVGAQEDHGWAGSAYVFDVTSGAHVAKLLASDGADMDVLGCSVAVSGGLVAVGAWGVDKPDDGGAVYLFDAAPAPLGTSYCGPAVPNSSGSSGVMAAFGSDAVADNCVQLYASGMALGQFGMFLTSETQGFVVPPGSQGNLCLGGSIGRYSKDIQNSGPAGMMWLSLDLDRTPTPKGLVAVQPGETWYFQAWFRDKNPVQTSNFTDGVSIGFQ